MRPPDPSDAPTNDWGFPDPAAVLRERGLKPATAAAVERQMRPQADRLDHPSGAVLYLMKSRGGSGRVTVTIRTEPWTARAAKGWAKASLLATLTAHSEAAALWQADQWLAAHPQATTTKPGGGDGGEPQQGAPPPPPPEGDPGPGGWRSWFPEIADDWCWPADAPPPQLGLAQALELLGLAAGEPLTMVAVATAYRAKALAAHPDHGGSAEQFQQLLAAREVARTHARPRLPQDQLHT